MKTATTPPPSTVKNTCGIRVLGVDTSNAWFMGTGNPDYLYGNLLRIFRLASEIDNLEAKRMIRAIKSGATVDIPLSSVRYYEGVCNCLSQLGVAYEITGSDPSPPSNPAA